MKSKIISSQKKKEFNLKTNEYINQKFHEKKLKNKINKNCRKFFNKYIFEILLIVIFDILFFSLSTSENIRKTSTVYTISIIILGYGHSDFLNNQINFPDIIKINNKEVKLTKSFYQFYDFYNKVELTWYNRPSCKSMFQYCNKIVSIDFSSFDTTGVTDMSSMFSECGNLKYIKFGSSFDTSSVKSMKYMFFSCSKLIALDLSMFKTESLTTMSHMFYKASSLLFLDLSSFNTASVESMNNMCVDCTSLVYINLKSFEEKENCQYTNIISTNMIDLKYCIDSSKCPHIYNNIYNINTNNVCDDDCFKDNYKLIPENKNCINDCQSDETYIYEDNNICYKYKVSPLYKDDEERDSEEKESNESPEESKESPEESNESSEESNESSEENSEKFFAENFFKESQQTSKEELSNKDEITKSLKENIINGNLSSLLTNLVNGTKEDLIAEYKDITYQLTTTENQKNGSYNNISTVDLGECEDKLKDVYGINSNISLIILKIDYKMEGLLIPVIGYEVYHPLNMSQLNLSYCSGINIKLNIPVSIDEDEVEKYDPNSDYYNDDCYAYTSENGTDIILNDRKNEYSDNNLSLCENNCEYNGYNSETKKALCECVTKIEIDLISDIISNENLLSNNLSTSENSKTNIGTMKCVSLLFSKNGLIKNIGSYLILLTLALFGVSIFIFYKCGYELIEQKIKEIVDLKTKKNDIFNEQLKDEKRIKKTRKKSKKKYLSNPGKKRKKKRHNIGFNQKLISPSKTEFKHTNTILNNEKTISIYKGNNIQKSMNSINYKEIELNLLDYKQAILFDKRTFIEYYSNLNKIKISALFAFYPMDDYNIKIIKICLFFLSFVIYFSVNTFFFNDDTLHQIYLDGGKYNLIYFLPQIIYSFIICILINNIIKYFCLSERNLLEIKNEENIDEISDKADSVKRCLIIKYIIFFISSFVFLIVFWYYLSSFCAVYQNTQIYLLINTIISFILGSIFPLMFNLITSLLRINSLKNQTSQTLYSISKFVQIL